MQAISITVLVFQLQPGGPKLALWPRLYSESCCTGKLSDTDKYQVVLVVDKTIQ